MAHYDDDQEQADTTRHYTRLADRGSVPIRDSGFPLHRDVQIGPGTYFYETGKLEF
jgi:hypothetical protein